MVRNNHKKQREVCRDGLLRKGYTLESVDPWLTFWDQPLMKSAFFDASGMVIGYIDPKKGRVEDRSGKLHETYQEKLSAQPRLAR